VWEFLAADFAEQSRSTLVILNAGKASVRDLTTASRNNAADKSSLKDDTAGV